MSDLDKVKSVLIAGGHKLRPDSVSIEDGKLWFRIEGNDSAGNEAIRTLLSAGLNSKIDEDMTTNENGAIWNEGALFCKCWIQLVSAAEIWRE